MSLRMSCGGGRICRYHQFSMRPYIAAARLFFELLDAMTPISVDLPEQRHFPVERQVGDRDQMRRFGTGPADVQGTHDSAFFAHVEDARHIASRRNGRTRGRCEPPLVCRLPYAQIFAEGDRMGLSM